MIHVVAEFNVKDQEIIKHVDLLRPILDKIVTDSKLNAIDAFFHQFNPHGITGVYVLAESHFAVHTWPEHNHLHVDLFSCTKDDEPAHKAVDLICKRMNATLIKKDVMRPDLHEKRTNNQ